VGVVNPNYPGTTYYDQKEHAYYVQGSGKNIWDKEDGFQFAFVRKSGDFIVTARLTNFYGYRDNQKWAKAGIMIRETLDGNSTHAAVVLNSKKGVGMYYRDGAGTDSLKQRRSEYYIPQAYLKLVKVGNTITAYESSGDVLGWRYTGEATMATWLDSTSEFYVGMAVTSRDSSVIATCVFEEFAFTSTGVGVRIAFGSTRYFTAKQNVG
jgi:hypothetical protein